MPQIIYFAYLGPNRRSDRRLVEAHLDFSAEQADVPGFDRLVARIRGMLLTAGVLSTDESFPAEPFPDKHMGGFSSLLAQTTLLFQQKAGHRVSYHEVVCTPGKSRCTVLVEHEHCDVGLNAMKLAVELLTTQRTELTGTFRQLREFAGQRALPLETEAIIAAARRRHIPYQQMDRFPLNKPSRTGRIRSNGLLRLGQGARGRLLDGTFLPEEASAYVKAWFKSAKDRQCLLESLDVSPVSEPAVNSRKFHALVIGERFFALEETSERQFEPVWSADESIVELSRRVYRAAGNQPVCLLLAGAGLDQPFRDGNINVLDFQLAPDLGVLFSENHEHANGLLDDVADCLVDDLFPNSDDARIPTVAITATNGKTTTSRMVGHILRFAGLKPALVCTNGIYINGEMISDKDAGSIDGHASVLVRNDIESAVLETHHRGIYLRGFAFHDCDVGVCLNVTEDHLEKGGIESVDELVEIKGALVERARKAAILFADNPGSRSMCDRVSAKKLWLVSLQSDVTSLRDLAGNRSAGFCVLENPENHEWLVIHDHGRRIPLMRSGDIPATYDGTARFNISNAMHAACAAYEVGVPVDTIRSALSRFRAGRQQSPGRLNVYDQLPHRVIVDNAHNPDGLRQLMKFVDRQSPSGRKLICFAAPSGRQESMYRDMARAVCGHFDRYFCNDRIPKGRNKPDHYAPILRDELLARGIDEQNVSLAKRGREGWNEVFAACAPGDLLMLIISPVEFDDADRFINAVANKGGN